MLYSQKPAPLKVPCDAIYSNSSTIENIELKKRTIAEEQDWAKKSKRRRPSLNSTVTDQQEKLIAAKLALAVEAKRQLELEAARKEEQEAEEARRKEELF
jgi:hypothetical protein